MRIKSNGIKLPCLVCIPGLDLEKDIEHYRALQGGQEVEVSNETAQFLIENNFAELILDAPEGSDK